MFRSGTNKLVFFLPQSNKEFLMFSFSRMKDHYKKAAVLVLFTALLFASCSSDVDSSGNLIGTWYDGYAHATIDASTMTIKYENSYEGEIINSPDFTSAKGVLIIKFTKYWIGDYSSYPNVTYTQTAIYNGQFGALYWNELKSGSVKMADAYEAYTHVMFNNIQDAMTNFTMDKAGNYVDWSILAPFQK